MTSPQLVLAWLLLAHLLADFVLQTEAIAVGKFGHGRPAWRALGIHSLIVAAVNAPLLLVFGLPGLAYVMLTTASHLLIDRGKIVLTLRRTAPHGAIGAVDAQLHGDGDLRSTWAAVDVRGDHLHLDLLIRVEGNATAGRVVALGRRAPV